MRASRESEIGLLRLAALGLLPPRAATPTEAVRGLLALQGQDLPGALDAVALRVGDGTEDGRDAVRAAFDAGEIVRSWPMRGTLHVVAAEDLAWMLPLARPRVLAAVAQRRPGLGLDDASVGAAGEVAGAALAGGGRLTRSELFARWADAGISSTSSQGSHLLRTLALTGLLVHGPFASAKEQQVVLLDDWVPAPRRLGREEGLAEWARRYFAAHGPATVVDFARWTDLPAADVRAGVAAAREHLASMEVDGREHLLDPTTPDRLAAARAEAVAEHRLPGFDEFVLGYRERDDVLDPEHFDVIVPGGNGMFRPTVVVGGRVVGTWRVVGSGRNRRIEKVPFGS